MGLIYSPAISSGVSIEERHFTRISAASAAVVPSDAIQMLRRDGTATEFMVDLNKLRGVREERRKHPPRVPAGAAGNRRDKQRILMRFWTAIACRSVLPIPPTSTSKFKVAAMNQARNDFR